MKGALIILIFTAMVGLILYLLDRAKRLKPQSDSYGSLNNSDNSNSDNPSSSDPTDSSENPDSCCGMHLVCEKELTAIAKGEILYYDDEELDRFAERDQDSYSPTEIEKFRDVLMTLLPEDVPGWARSLDARKIQPPREIRDELLILLSDAMQ